MAPFFLLLLLKNSAVKILLHTCCGPCASASLERLLEEKHDVTLFFSNSNIAPEAEFYKRAKYAQQLADAFKTKLIVDEYDHKAWLSFIKGFESEPEKGLRCPLCFEFSMNRTQLACEKYGFNHFSTTLTVSPHKNSKILLKTGEQFADYYHVDFKKRDGFKRSIELSEELGLYRQSYCGCEFSMR